MNELKVYVNGKLVAVSELIAAYQGGSSYEIVFSFDNEGAMLEWLRRYDEALDAEHLVDEFGRYLRNIDKYVESPPAFADIYSMWCSLK